MTIRAQSKRHAFTLLEIMLVVAIIAMLLTAGFFFIGDNFGLAAGVKTQADLQAFDQRLKTYQMMNGFLPTTEQGLQALVTMPQTEPRPTRWNQMMERLPEDAWHSPYIYVCPGVRNPNSYDLYSVGKDHKQGTADDQGTGTRPSRSRGGWQFAPGLMIRPALSLCLALLCLSECSADPGAERLVRQAGRALAEDCRGWPSLSCARRWRWNFRPPSGNPPCFLWPGRWSPRTAPRKPWRCWTARALPSPPRNSGVLARWLSFVAGRRRS